MKGEKDKRLKKLSIRISEVEYGIIKQKADIEGLSMSDYMRKASIERPLVGIRKKIRKGLR